MYVRFAELIQVVETVWHMGCLIEGCEGLRVLGTWIKPGWGLGITEIGRTGISSPHKIAGAVLRQPFRKKPRKATGAGC